MASRYDGNRRYDDYERGYDRRGSNSMNDGPNWGKILAIILSIILALVVVGGALVYYFGNSLINLTNYVSDEEQKILTEEELQAQMIAAGEVIETTPAASDQAVSNVEEEETETEPVTEYHIGVAVNDEELEEIQLSMNQVDETVETVTDEGVFNVVLTGVDRRDKSWNGNSDSMMLVSINYDKKRVSIISLMRDTYVAIPEVGYAKLNNAYARGGGSLMCATISDNYNIDVSNYVAVDFEDMIEIIDALGGIEMEWTDAEVQVSNGYIVDMCDTLGLNYADYILPGAGVYNCNGVQAVAYARNRYVGNSDYARTERQRYVISQILNKVQNMDIASVTVFITKVLPLVTHNLDESVIWDLVTKVTEIFGYTFVTDRVPYDGMYDVIYVNGQDMLVPYWTDTIIQMHETIYGDGSTSSNSDNNQEDRTVNNQSTNIEFEVDILNGGAEEETPYSGE